MGRHDNQHQFLHIELRSTTPFPVELGNETWRIVREENNIGGLSNSVLRPAAVMFKRDSSGTALTVGPGENFTIGTMDGMLTKGLMVADMYVDHDGDGHVGLHRAGRRYGAGVRSVLRMTRQAARPISTW